MNPGDATSSLSDQIDATDKRLLNLLQKGLPLVSHPFQLLGEELELGEEETLARTAALQARGLIRRIDAIVEPRALGYQSTLVAFTVPPDRLDSVGRLVAQHPGVGHNYARNHRYNLWFTLCLPKDADLTSAVQELALRAEVISFVLLPAVRRFKRGVFFDLEQGVARSSEATDSGRYPGEDTHQAPSAQEQALLAILQDPFPLQPQPFALIARRLGVHEEEVVAHTKELLRRGVIQRLGAVIHHRQVGFRANAMICWRVPPARMGAVGQTLAGYPEVTHCYQRLTAADWPYGLFTVVHAQSPAACESMAQKMAQEVHVPDYVLLFSTKQYKMERPKYV